MRLTPARTGFLLLLLCTAVVLSACGAGPSEKTWTQAVSGAKQVSTSLQQGAYSSARRDWKPVDNVIHATYPHLHAINPTLANKVWYAMGLVELGFLNDDWTEARRGASALPALLAQAHEVWTGSR